MNFPRDRMHRLKSCLRDPLNCVTVSLQSRVQTRGSDRLASQKVPIERRLISSLWISRVANVVNKICRIRSAFDRTSNVPRCRRRIKRRRRRRRRGNRKCVPLQSGVWMDIKMVEEVEKMKKEDGIFLHGKNYNIDTVLGDTEESREIIRCTWPSINTLCEYRWREEIQWLVRYFLISSSD